MVSGASMMIFCWGSEIWAASSRRGTPDNEDGATSYKSGSYWPSALDLCRLMSAER